jgi:hypothetical protein
LVALIDAYGADERRWPQAERGALTEAGARDPDVAAALTRARELDAMLEHGREAHALPPALRERLLVGAPAPRARTVRAKGRRTWLGAPWVRASGLAATLLVGVMGGYAAAATAFQPAGPEQTLLGIALSDTGDPFAALLEDGA